ncbi:hypothetical protein LZ30DRAFT_707669 [Colletotrichum cereale]|nr:hypothetical protein LZ30DRAFT_707669 [Colletotrichum cereale]
MQMSPATCLSLSISLALALSLSLQIRPDRVDETTTDHLVAHAGDSQSGVSVNDGPRTLNERLKSSRIRGRRRARHGAR